jgi:uncharacterized radical SAM protein YgiQ
MSFLPISRDDMKDRGWDSLDFIFVSGDAYVDHPSFGCSVITRVLESEGFKVGIIAQPDWRDTSSFKKLGRPKYAALVSSGVVDSMVNHYTAAKKPRTDDRYSPGGVSGFRPDRAVIVYTTRIKEAFKGLPVVIGGIEASLRRFAHYDYWSNKVRRSILLDSKADLLVYGMGEYAIREIAHAFADGKSIREVTNIRGTAYVTDRIGSSLPATEPGIGLCDGNGTETSGNIIELPSFDDVSTDRKKYAEAFAVQEDEQDPIRGKTLVQKHGDRLVIQNPPAPIPTVEEMDRIYSLPYERAYHPSYEKSGGVPAIEEVKFSITSHRGCFGGCAFCALSFHQGRIISKRSEESIVAEAGKLVSLPGFKGYIHDVGGPTANFRNPACEQQLESGTCRKKRCLFPGPCSRLVVDHGEYLRILRRLRKLPGIKKIFIRSGIRYDYLFYDRNDEFFRELCEHHVSGQLKVAPEHVSQKVLVRMRKPARKVYDGFVKKYFELSKALGKEQYLVPYLVSGHPGSDLAAACELACYLRETGYIPEQVQDFYPTPGTASTCMYFTGLDPHTMEEVYVPRDPEEKAMQRALLQFRRKENYALVFRALTIIGRNDLIGFGKECLIWPKRDGGRNPSHATPRDGKKYQSNRRTDTRRSSDRRNKNRQDR